MTKALLIRTNGQHQVLDLPKDDSYEIIKEAVGGWLDTVSNENGSIVGYLHDEGLLIGLPVNVVATLLFQMPLVGDMVLVGGLDKDGNYDGENHDLDPKFFDEGYLSWLSFISTNELVIGRLNDEIACMDLSPKVFALTDDEMGKYLSTGELPAEPEVL